MAWANLYLVFLISTFFCALRYAGFDERFAAGTMLLGSVATALMLLIIGRAWSLVEFGVLFVDGCALVAFCFLAFRSKKFWPLWVTAFQLVGFLTHLARMVSPHILPKAYSAGQAFWAYPQLAIILIVSLGYFRARHQKAT